jgi:hypothetical protein
MSVAVIERTASGCRLATSMSHMILKLYGSSPDAQPADQQRASRPDWLARMAMSGSTRRRRTSNTPRSRKKSFGLEARTIGGKPVQIQFADAALHAFADLTTHLAKARPSHVEAGQGPLQEGDTVDVAHNGCTLADVRCGQPAAMSCQAKLLLSFPVNILQDHAPRFITVDVHQCHAVTRHLARKRSSW